ncbi:glycerate kinase [Nitriliruptoraceae bacterium ZYF776]|nr:glycerate kinase [Profundirhabdus halotolerans]
MHGAAAVGSRAPRPPRSPAVRVVVVTDGLAVVSSSAVAASVADGWREVRPADELVLRPLSDGGRDLLDVLAPDVTTRRTTEVAGPQGHPLDANWALRDDGTAVVDATAACGRDLLPPERRTPRLATSYGVGQLLDAARDAGARRILVGGGAPASVDGGAGALSGLGFRLTVADGSGLKIGGDDLGRVAAAGSGWSADWHDVEVVLLTDRTTVLGDTARRAGPGAGAAADELDAVAAALTAWAQVAERDLAARGWRDEPGSGDLGGVPFGLACALPRVRLVDGTEEVAAQVGLDADLAGADLVVVAGARHAPDGAIADRVLGHVVDAASASGVPVVAVTAHEPRDARLRDAEVVAVATESADLDVFGVAAARLARRHG